MAKKLISIDDAVSAGSRLPASVRTEISVLPAVQGKRTGTCYIIPGLGQSNMTEADTALLATSDHRLCEWDGTNIVQVPTNKTYALPSFAREFVNTIPKGDWVLIVPAAVGATGFTTTTITPLPSGFVAGTGTWDRTIGDAVNLPARAVTATLAARTAALAAGASAVEIPVMLWSQGEGDTPRLTESQYAAKLDDLISWFRTQISTPNLLVLIGSMVPEYGYLRGNTNTAGVAAALAFTPARVQRTAFAWGPEGLPKQGEVIHYSTAAQMARGRLFMQALERARVNVTGTKPVPPSGLVVTRSVSGRITARWQEPLCRLIGYDVEYTTNGGSTWAPMALDRDSRLRATMVVTPDLVVQVRIRSKSDGTTTTSLYALSEPLFAVSGAPAPTETAPTPIADPALPGVANPARTQFVGGENVSPAHTGALTLYAAYTLPASGGGITVVARSNDSTRAQSLLATQSDATDITQSITGGGSAGVSFPAPKATAGPHITALSISADGANRLSKRGSAAAVATSTATGNILVEALRVAVAGSAVLHGAYIYYGQAHTEAQMTAIQEELRVLHGLASI